MCIAIATALKWRRGKSAQGGSRVVVPAHNGVPSAVISRAGDIVKSHKYRAKSDADANAPPPERRAEVSVMAGADASARAAA